MFRPMSFEMPDTSAASGWGFRKIRWSMSFQFVSSSICLRFSALAASYSRIPTW